MFAPWLSIPCYASSGVGQKPYSGMTVSVALAAGVSSGLRTCRFFRPLFSVVLSQLCGSFLFPSGAVQSVSNGLDHWGLCYSCLCLGSCVLHLYINL